MIGNDTDGMTVYGTGAALDFDQFLDPNFELIDHSADAGVTPEGANWIAQNQAMESAADPIEPQHRRTSIQEPWSRSRQVSNDFLPEMAPP